MAIEHQEIHTNRFEATVAAGNQLVLLNPRRGAGGVTVAVTPNGSTVTVAHSLADVEDVQRGLGTFHDWPAGGVTVRTEDVLVGAVTALRISVVGGTDALVQVVQ